MIAVGIDPGLTGGVAFIDSRGSCVVADIPTTPLLGTGLIRRRVDGAQLAGLLREHCPIGERVVVGLEAVHTIGVGSGKNNAVQTQGSLMRTLGSIEAVLEVLRLDFRSVDAQAWKGFYGLGSVKREAIQKALVLYPSAPLRLVSDHNKAEALLIAHWALRTLQ